MPLPRTRVSRGQFTRPEGTFLAERGGGADAPDRGIPRAATGISGLDAILNGGVPKGNVVLLSGACGTGKTTIGLEILCNGARQGESGLFFTTTEPVARIVDNAAGYSFFEKGLVGKKLHFVDALEVFEELNLKPELESKDIDTFLRWLGRTIKDRGASRVVIDSLTGICYRIPKRELIREFTYRLGRTLSDLGCTTIATSETQPGETKYSSFQVEEAVADGIILLGNHDSRGYLLRTLQVVKMRGTVHSRARYVVDLTSHVAQRL